MRMKVTCLFSACVMLGCATRPQASDTDESESGDAESESGDETATETGEDMPEPFWVYSSEVQPRALAATSNGVVVAGTDLTNARARVIMLDASGELVWTASWLSVDDLPSSAIAVDWDAGMTWVGFSEGVAYLDSDGVEQWRQVPLDIEVLSIRAIDGDLIVVGASDSGSRSHMIRLGSDGAEQWRWDAPLPMMDMPAPPFVRDVVLGDDSLLWAMGSRYNMEMFEVVYLGRFDPANGAPLGPVFAGLGAVVGGGQAIELLGDGLVVTTQGDLSALEVDGVLTWQVSVPDGRCPIDVADDTVMVGCETELQLRDVQSTLITKWEELALEQPTVDYHWQDVALGVRAFAGIGSDGADPGAEGKVYGLELE